MSKQQIKLVSWNVNGLRAVMKKDFAASAGKLDADVLAIQETKLQAPQVTEAMRSISGYQPFFAHATSKKGYSGVAAYSRSTPRAVKYGFGVERFDVEGRVVELDMGDFIFFNVYFPNGQMSDARLTYKLDFYKAFFDYADAYRRQGRSLVISGDFNTAHQEIDLKNPKANEKRSGFLPIERQWLDQIISRGYVDTFRALHPDQVQYSWWTYRFKAREKNVGWRIDYFFVTQEMMDKGQVKEAFIDNAIFGSDHCPVGLVLEV